MNRFVLSISLGLAFALCVISAVPQLRAEEEVRGLNWEQIAFPKADIPEPHPTVEKEVFLFVEEAFNLAKKYDSPVLVEVRCAKMKGIPSVEKMMEENSPAKDPLRHFVKLIIENARELDTRMFPLDKYQDLDKTWWAWLMSPEGVIYGVFGGNEQSSRDLNFPAADFARTLKLVLSHHYDARRKDWGIDGKPPAMTGKAIHIRDLMGFDSWEKKHRDEVPDKDCLFCHFVDTIYRQPLIDAKKFNKKTDYYTMPYPENLGITTPSGESLKVAVVKKGSAAEKAGIAAGDVICAANGHRLFSSTDLRVALGMVSATKPKLSIVYIRDNKPATVELKLEEGWKEYDLSWRPSVAQGGIGARTGFPWPMEVDAKTRNKLNIPADSMAVKPFFGKDTSKSVAHSAGLRPDHIIVAVNGKSPNIASRAFVVWVRLNFEPGDPVELKVKDAKGGDLTIKYKLP